MNWDAIGAIAETLGAVGVIASLVYLATQIRLNTRSVRGATYQTLIGVQGQTEGNLLYDGEAAAIVHNGMQDLNRLSEVEAFRFNWFMGGVVSTFENAHYQLKNGMLSPDRWELQVEYLRFYLSMPGIRKWWAGYAKSTVSGEVRRLIDEQVRLIEEAEA